MLSSSVSDSVRDQVRGHVEDQVGRLNWHRLWGYAEFYTGDKSWHRIRTVLWRQGRDQVLQQTAEDTNAK